MTAVNQIGIKQDISVRRGTTAGAYQLQVLDVDAVVVDLSSVTPVGGIYIASGTTKIADWTFDTTNAADGIILFTLAAEDTATLATSKLSLPAKHTWVINLVWGDGTVVPAYYGDFRAIVGDGE